MLIWLFLLLQVGDMIGNIQPLFIESGGNFGLLFLAIVIVILILCASIFFLLCTIYFILTISRNEIYESGIIPAFQPFKSKIYGYRYFIPFNQISKIGVLGSKDLEHAYNFLFIMNDGSVAPCKISISELKKTRNTLVPLLKEKSSTAEIIRIKRERSEEGLDLTQFEALSADSNGKNHEYRPH